MQFFTATMEQLSAYQELMRARQEGVTPVSFTGVSQIHKAHLAGGIEPDLGTGSGHHCRRSRGTPAL